MHALDCTYHASSRDLSINCEFFLTCYSHSIHTIKNLTYDILCWHTSFVTWSSRSNLQKNADKKSIVNGSGKNRQVVTHVQYFVAYGHKIVKVVFVEVWWYKVKNLLQCYTTLKGAEALPQQAVTSQSQRGALGAPLLMKEVLHCVLKA